MNRHFKMIGCPHEMTEVTSNHLKSGQIVTVLATLLFLSLDFPAFAKTLFAGNFVELHGDVRQRDVSVNYPARSKDGICGVEIKSSVTVLNSQVWARLAAALSVAEIQDDVAERPVSPVILNQYSPQLFYRFSDDGRDYSTIRFSSLSDEPLQTVFDRVLGGGQAGVKVIAVAQPCAGFTGEVESFKNIPVEFADNLIRSPRPESEFELRKWASDYELTTVLSLDDYNVGNLTLVQERAWVRGAGLEFVHMPMHFLKGPTTEELEAAVDYVIRNQSRRRVLIHCKYGKDRTGLVVAGFRMRAERWPLFEAVKELYQYGHSKILSFWDRKLRHFMRE